MGRKMQDKHSDSYWDNHHPEFNSSLFHIIKHHPLCHHFIKRQAYRNGDGERSDAENVAQRGEAFSDDKKKNLSLGETRNSNVEQKVTPNSSVEKNTLRSQIKELVKEISKKRSRQSRSSTTSTHDDLEESNIDPFSETVLTDQSSRIKRSLQCDATPSTDFLGCKHQPVKNDLLAKQCRVEDNTRKHTSGVSTHFCKHFVGASQTVDKNKDLLLTFLHNPVSPLVYHFHKHQMYRAKATINRSVSFPLPISLSKRQGYEPIGNDCLPKGQGKLNCGNKTEKSVQFESSKKICEQATPSAAKRRVNGNLNTNEAVVVREVNFSSGSAHGQNQKEIKHIKNLKQKIEHVTKESRKEKLRVAMDSVIHKLPQGQGISDELKKEILKKLTEPNITREGQHCLASCKVNDPSTCSFPMRRIWSLQEPLESYCQNQENSFNTEEARHPQSEEQKLRTEKAHSPLRMLIPLQRILSLPDLQSYSYASQNGEISDISSLTKPIIASGDSTVSSESIAYQKKRLGLIVHSKSQLQLDTLVEDLTQENLVSVDENDLVISSTILGSGSDCISKINDKFGRIIDDFGHSSFRNCGTFSDEVIGPIKEYNASIEASVAVTGMLSLMLIDSKSNPGSTVEQQEANMDFLKVIETTKNAQKLEILTKQLNYEIPNFHVETKHKAEFDYVKYVLEISGLTSSDECISSWHSRDTPVDPLLYQEMEGDPDFCSYKSGQCDHHVLFDLINETLLEIYGRTLYCYPLMKFMGCHTLHEVWTRMRKLLCLRSKAGHQTIDDHVSRDLAKVDDGWVNLQFNVEYLGLELEDLIFHDLLEEIMWDLT